MRKTVLLLILSTFFLFCFSAIAQNSYSDPLSIVKNGTETEYYQGERLVSLYQLMNVTKENTVAYAFIQQSYALNKTSIRLNIVGGFFLGFSVGYIVSSAITKNLVNLNILIPMLGTGAVFITCGVTCKIVSNNKMQKGLQLITFL
jgi:hypothetical protein